MMCYLYSLIFICNISLFVYLIVNQQLINAKITNTNKKTDAVKLNTTQLSPQSSSNTEAIIIPYEFKKYREDDSQLQFNDDLSSSHAFYKINLVEKQCDLNITFGDVICVECDIFTKKKKKKIQCDGVGEWMQESRFNSLKYVCNGKWLKLTPELKGNCTDSFSYVFM